MLKFVGLLLLFSSVALLGFGAAASLGERAQYLSTLVSFWRQFAIQLERLRATPRQLVYRLAQQQEYNSNRFVQLLADGFAEGESFQEAMERTLSACPELNEMGVVQPLRGLEDVIGRQPLESQLAALAGVTALLQEQHQHWQEESRRKGSLYRRLGLLGGGLLTVLFI